MSSLFKTLCALAVWSSSSTAIAADREPLLYGGARAGATVEELKALSSIPKPPVGEKPYVHGTTCELVRWNYSISGMEMQQCYHFKDDKLVMVRVHADVTEMVRSKKLSMSERTLLANAYFRESVKTLTEKYGRPTKKEGNPSAAYYRWERDTGLVIELSTVRAFASSTSVWFSDGSLPSASPVRKPKK
ncbi:hypothetical protein [Erythrobacter crassostreae]|uniref:SmpA / OmlA family protein n=1 Tax=Erythrobacter crassostreae TaxID=2828328 RepID=A0A9X1F489_9SPHN|nr:hypothetical protein [Erythrobacter crassostrea]MBV7259519.1 hypothetical protein [Erythrobacter crassostrea]